MVTKILEVTSGYPPVVGGVENSVGELVTRLRVLGHDVKVVTAGLFSVGVQEDVWRLPVRFRVEREWGDLYFCPSIFRALRSIEFDIVHAHTPRKFFAEAVAFHRLSTARKFPYIVSIRLWNKSLRGLSKEATQVYRKTIERLVLKGARFVVVQTRENKAIVSENFGIPMENIEIVPNGVDAHFFDPAKFPKETTRRSIGLGDEKTLLFVGRLTTQKGLSPLVLAIPEIKKVFRDAKFLIVGEGPLRQELQELARKLGVLESIVFLGEIPHRNIARYYSIADVFIMPSLSESFPNVMLEAMAMEKACIASRVGAVSEVATDFQNSLLIEPNNSGQIAKAAIALLSDDSLRRRLGANARNLIRKEYSWDSVIDKTLHIYEKALA